MKNNFFSLNPQPSWIFDYETLEILDVNIAAIEHYGYKREEFLKLTLKDLRPPQEVPELINAHVDIKNKEGNIYFGIFTHQKRNGNVIRMEINGHKVNFNDRHCMLMVCQDVTEKENQQEILEENSRRLAAISSIGKIGYWRLELDGESLFWTDEVNKIWGVNKENSEVSVENFEKTIHPDDRKAFISEQKLALAEKRPLDLAHRIILSDHSIKWVRVRGRLIKDENGEPFAFEGTVQDITEKKKIELQLRLTGEKLRESEQRFRTALEISPDGFTILHPERNNKGEIIDFTWVFQNQSIARINGTDPNKVIGKRLLELFPSHQGTAIFNAYIEVARTGNTRVINDVYVGEIVSVPTWIRLVIVPMGDDIAILSQNITQQKSAEAFLKESAARFRTIFEGASLGVAQVNTSTGQIIFINAYYETITGYTREELLAMSFFELTHPDDREKDWMLFNKAAQGEQDYRNEKRYIRKDGKVIWVRIHLAFIRDDQGKALSTVAICENITTQKEKEVRIQDLSDNLPGVVFQYLLYTDGTDALRAVSKGAYKVWGYSPEEVEKDIDLVWSRTKAGGKFEIVKQSILTAANTKTKWLAQYKVVLPSGEVQTHLGSGTPNFLRDGTVVFNSVVLDITKEVKNKELLSQATQIANIGNWEVDLVKNEISWSGMVHKLHETDPGTFVPDLESSISFYHEDFRNIVKSHVHDCIRTGKPFDFEAVLVTVKKNERWVRAIGHAEMVEGQNKRIYGSFQDIHFQKINEIALKESLKNLQDYQYAIDQLASFTITDSNGVIISVNDKFCELSQYSKEELLGSTHQVINSKYHPKDFFAGLWQAIKSGEIWRGEVRNQKKDGTYYWVDATIVPFLDENKKPFQYLALRIDITARKQAEEKILAAYEKLKNIAWTQSHVVRSPLARILGVINAIETLDIQPDELPFWLEQLKSSSLEMDEIIQDIVNETQLIDFKK
ncbi:MAG: PAS domain S-box protein [Cyclobacteriaceae bacterium]